MRKRILHIINSLTIGGAETLLVNSLSPGGLQEHTDNYLVYFNKDSFLLNQVDRNVKIFNLNYTGGKDIVRILKQLRAIIKEHKIEIVHTHLTPAGLYTHLVCPAMVPHVHTIHSTYSMDNETRPWMRWLERKFFLEKRNCNIISLSEYTKDDFLRSVKFKGNIFVLNNFVNSRFFDVQKNNTRTVIRPLRLLAVGALKPLKNFEYLQEVFRHLTDLEIYLDIYGDGDMAAYEQKNTATGLRISMKGFSNDIAAVMPGYDLFIMPSKFEGFPLSVFEAMAAGIPLMLSDIAPLRSIVHNNALYFPLNDAMAVAATLRQIYQHEIDINGMAVKAKQYAINTVNREKYKDQLLKIYEQCKSAKLQPVN